MSTQRRAETHPIPLPEEIESIVTRGLRRFAENAGFELIDLYHNESVWYLKRVREALIERVQVAAFGSPISPTLRFIPDISEIDVTSNVRKMSSSVPGDAIASVLIHSLASSGVASDSDDLIETAASSAVKWLDVLRNSKRDRVVHLRGHESPA